MEKILRSILCFVAILIALAFAGDVVIQIVDTGGGASGHNARAKVTESMRLRHGIVSGVVSLAFFVASFILYRSVKKSQQVQFDNTSTGPES